MTVRHAVLPFGAVLVLGLGVYLFIEVRAQPAPLPLDRASRASAMAPQGSTTAVAAAPVPERPVPARAAPISRSGEPAPTVPGAAGATPDDPLAVGPRLDAVMDEANRAYDRSEYDEAKQIAGRVLARFPGNVRMLRIMVSASCIDGDAPGAQAYYPKLPPVDQEQMKVRCARSGIAFP